MTAIKESDKIVPQVPAEGITKLKGWPDAKYYQVPCQCGCDNEISFFVEIDEFNISATFCSKTKTKYWYNRLNIDYNEPWLLLNFKVLFNDWYNRLDICWRALTKGYVETESCVILTPQQCVNFSATLNTAVADFEVIVAEREAKYATEKANEKKNRTVKKA